MISVARNNLRVVMMIAGLSLAALAAGGGCAVEESDEDILWDQDELDDEGDVDDGSGDDPGGIEDAVPLICQPDEIEGRVLRLSLDSTGAMRARGTVWSNVAPCNVSVHIELRRSGNLVDSQQKSCGDESCRSRLLSAGNPAGDQTFCAIVRQTATGSVLDRQCKVR